MMNNKEKVEAAYRFIERMPRNVKAFCERLLNNITETGKMDAAIEKNAYDLNAVSYLDLYSYIEYSSTAWRFDIYFWIDVEDWAEAQDSNQKGENNG